MKSTKTITAGRMRFQFYSGTIVRIEYSPSQNFRDQATSVVTGRSIAGAQVERNDQDGGLSLTTSRLTIRCSDAESAPTPSSLTVEWRGKDNPRAWRFGEPDRANLGGTLKSLDHLGAGNLPPVGDGVLSRDHFFVIDDSVSPVWDPETDRLRPQAEQGYADIYFAAYDNYQEGLRALAMLTGNVPMIPKSALGLWFSNYYPYSSKDYMEIVRKFGKMGMRVDVMVLDVDWHTCGWEGYDWNTDLIPHPKALLNWFHERNIKVSLNIHPGGLPAQDSHAEAARAALGLESDAPVRFNLAEVDQSRAYFKLLHEPLAELGADIWWIDGESADMPGLNSQLWTNHAYYQFAKNNSTARPMILSRYGGLGSQRYPIGFSGDAKSDWSMLAYQVRFTATSSNALMPYWSHDIGGFTGSYLDTQLFIRWVQFGAVSPFLRLHSDHGDRAPWHYGSDALHAFRKAFDLRLAAVPFFYSLCYQAHIESIPPVRPMYYQWPDDEECYRQDGQYMIGDSILVHPVTFPASDGGAHVDVYLPEGIWFDFHAGMRIDGGRFITYSCPIDRIPIFVRAGAIIPTQRGKSAACACTDPLEIHLYPGADGEFTHYEDDGDTQRNEQWEYATNEMLTKTFDTGVSFLLGPTDDTFLDREDKRTIIVTVHGVTEPSTVLLNTRPIAFDYHPAAREALVVLQVDFRYDHTVVFFEGAEVLPQFEPSAKLEVSAALMPASDSTPPRLRLSAIHSPISEPRPVVFSLDLPPGWMGRPVQDVPGNLYILELSIPKSMAPGTYKICGEASLPVEGGLEQAACSMEWAYSSVTDFVIMGTFDNSENRGMDIYYGPETDFGFHPMHEYRKWEPLNENAIVGDIMPVRYIDLTRHFGPIDYVISYAITYIHTESPRNVRFEFGSDDGMVAWLNGREILRDPTPGPAAPGQHRVPVSLRAGWNQVMLKIGQLTDNWGFYFEIRTEDGDPAEGLYITGIVEG